MCRWAYFAASAAALVIPLSSPGAAQNTGVFVGGAIGAVQTDDATATGTGINANVEHDVGYAGTAAVGYRFESGFRLETEFGYRSIGVDKATNATGTGDVEAETVFANLAFDVDTDGPWTPYVGVGIGGARLKYDGVSQLSGQRASDKDAVVAYQAIAGLAYKVGDATEITVDYRYLATADANMVSDTGNAFSTEYTSHNILVGLRFFFSEPAAPKRVLSDADRLRQPEPEREYAPPIPPQRQAPVAAAPQPPAEPQPPAPKRVASARSFFDWDSASLTPEARTIIAQIVTSAKHYGFARIETIGHADRSGPESYNLGLSRRRALAVRQELARHGILPSEISILAKGESEPLVPTRDGVREARNRRVEVLIR